MSTTRLSPVRPGPGAPPRACFMSLMALVLSWAPGPVVAGPPLAVDHGAPMLETEAAGLRVERHRLANGLDVVIQQDRRVASVALAILYHVGSRDETREQEGFAHLFEHMMFQGSDHVGKMAHFSLIEDQGGTVNAGTWKDFTTYYQELPRHQLPLALWLEAERMRSLAVSADNLANQQATVLEEMRQRYENKPYGRAQQERAKLAYSDWAYAHATIGTKEGIEGATLEMVQDFHSTWYVPNNATLVLAGDVDVAEAMALLREWFEPIPSRPLPLRHVPVEPEPTGPREGQLTDDNARLPALYLAWPVPGVSHPERYALEVLSRILGDGKSGRLYRRLVAEKRLAIQVSASLDSKAGPDLLNVTIIHEPGARQAVLDELATVLSELRDQGITEAERGRVANQVSTEFVYGLASNLHRAMLLAFYTFWYGDPLKINDEIAALSAVTAAEVRDVAARYLLPDRRTTLVVEVAR